MERVLQKPSLILLLALLSGGSAMSQSVIPTLDPNETPGQRPYEMVWAGRQEPAPPTLTFAHLAGWRMEVSGGAQAALQPSRAQDVWGRPVGKLRYHGDGKPTTVPRVLLFPPQPVALPEGADVVEMWVYGNRWDWENPPDTPQVRLTLHLRDGEGKAQEVPVDIVRWKEWWLLHRRLPAGLRFPAFLESLEVAGGWQPEWRELFFDSVRFFREPLPPLHFASRPQRNLTLFAGQSPGANTGPGRLPFPTREQTILPMHLGGPIHTAVTAAQDGTFTLDYDGKDCRLRYRFDPAKGLSGLRAEVDGAPVGALMQGAGVRRAEGPAEARLKRAHRENGILTAEYEDGTTLRLRLWQKSLVVDVINRSGQAAELSFGQMTGLTSPRTVRIPFLTYGGTDPGVLLSYAGRRPVFTSLWPDWYRSNGSEFYGAESSGKETARINGGVRYLPRTDGKRNPLFERLFLTVSPMLEEVLPTVPNPVGLHAHEAADRLWQESWGPDDYQKQEKRSEMLRAYGIEKLIQCNHEISWRDAGESFTLRLHAAPRKGGDEALRRYVAHQRGLGWFSGLYTNYTDYAPVNEYWNPDAVQRAPDGEWRSGWPRCWALKPLRAVEFDALLAPQIKAKYNSNSSYTDVHTAVAPWNYNDYDARVPGAGTLAQTFYAYGELLRNDSRTYGGPIFSEGTYQWLYAGLADGNYGHAYNGHPLATEPLLPVFDLYQIHSKECDIGVSWTSFFCDAMPNWRAPENIDYAIDRFLLHTLAYGHIGWLVEEEHGIARTCRSYYMLQQVQARYGLKPPQRIAYWDGARLCGVSEAVVRDLPRTRRQLYVEYPGGLKLWLNDHPREAWRVRVGKQEITLPPAGWAAYQSGAGEPTEALLSYSAFSDSGKVDYLRSASYTYLDGRGKWFATPEAASNGALALAPLPNNRLQVIHISGEGAFVVRRPYGRRGVLTACAAYDAAGKRLAPAKVHDSGAETWIEPVADGVRYELAFSGRPAWSAAPAFAEAAPGSRVLLTVKGTAEARWETDRGQVRANALYIPANAPVGTWIRLRATSGTESREALLRVCRPVEWRLETETRAGSTRLTLLPRWKLAGLSAQPLTVSLHASEGWQVVPSQLTVNPKQPSQALQAELRSSAPAGKEGELQIRVESLPQSAATWRLRRVQADPVLANLSTQIAAWGIARRGQSEIPEADGSGAICYPANDLPVGGVSKSGLFMHPPYLGKTGYTWAEMAPVTLPAEPSEFHASIGIKDGGDVSDGVLFRVEVIDAQGQRHPLAEQMGVQGQWRELRADLSPFAGQRVRLRLIADAGPRDNSTTDWASWGEPTLRLSKPQTVTQVSPLP
ncbi:MAG TPA: hypothetical protein VFB38_12460 [Chthonomonadaceae bacterium]|nr:hypothetical protein [Chthonomonadaceae bacterium]